MPTQPWLEGARDGQVVTRADLVEVLEGWRGQWVAGRRAGLAETDPVTFAVLFVTLVAAGATVVPLDPEAPPQVNSGLLRSAGASCVVSTERDTSATGQPLVPVDPRTLLPMARNLPMRSVSSGGCLLFSSGSTGPRKAIWLEEERLLHVARAVARSHELSMADRCLNPLPLFHVNAEVVALLASLVSGGTVVLDRGFHLNDLWQLTRSRSITWVNAVPAILTLLADRSSRQEVPPTVRFVRSASAPLPASVLRRFEQRCGLPVIESYGMTEAASQITVNPLRERRPGSVGKPVAVEVRVRSDAGREAAAGEVGSVLIRGRGVIRRYDHGAGADRFDADGWLDTGDLGSLDLDGYLWLAGREGDLVNRGGEKILPGEVEDVLRGHRGVREAVVIGRTDPVLGQVPVAYVVPGPGSPDDLLLDLDRRCATSLPPVARPAEIVLVGDLPHGPTGKMVRRLVAEHDRALAASRNADGGG